MLSDSLAGLSLGTTKRRASAQEGEEGQLGADASLQARPQSVPPNSGKENAPSTAPLGMSPSRMTLIQEELSCSICLELCVRPCTTACGHNFCRSCLRESIRHNHRCPKCRKALPPRFDLTINTTLWNTIQLLFPASALEPPTPQHVLDADKASRETPQARMGDSGGMLAAHPRVVSGLLPPGGPLRPLAGLPNLAGAMAGVGTRSGSGGLGGSLRGGGAGVGGGSGTVPPSPSARSSRLDTLLRQIDAPLSSTPLSTAVLRISTSPQNSGDGTAGLATVHSGSVPPSPVRLGAGAFYAGARPARAPLPRATSERVAAWGRGDEDVGAPPPLPPQLMVAVADGHAPAPVAVDAPRGRSSSRTQPVSVPVPSAAAVTAAASRRLSGAGHARTPSADYASSPAGARALLDGALNPFMRRLRPIATRLRPDAAASPPPSGNARDALLPGADGLRVAFIPRVSLMAGGGVSMGISAQAIHRASVNGARGRQIDQLDRADDALTTPQHRTSASGALPTGQQTQHMQLQQAQQARHAQQVHAQQQAQMQEEDAAAAYHYERTPTQRQRFASQGEVPQLLHLLQQQQHGGMRPRASTWADALLSELSESPPPLPQLTVNTRRVSQALQDALDGAITDDEPSGTRSSLLEGQQQQQGGDARSLRELRVDGAAGRGVGPYQSMAQRHTADSGRAAWLGISGGAGPSSLGAAVGAAEGPAPAAASPSRHAAANQGHDLTVTAAPASDFTPAPSAAAAAPRALPKRIAVPHGGRGHASRLQSHSGPEFSPARRSLESPNGSPTRDQLSPAAPHQRLYHNQSEHGGAHFALRGGARARAPGAGHRSAGDDTPTVDRAPDSPRCPGSTLLAYAFAAPALAPAPAASPPASPPPGSPLGAPFRLGLAGLVPVMGRGAGYGSGTDGSLSSDGGDARVHGGPLGGGADARGSELGAAAGWVAAGGGGDGGLSAPDDDDLFFGCDDEYDASQSFGELLLPSAMLGVGQGAGGAASQGGRRAPRATHERRAQAPGDVAPSAAVLVIAGGAHAAAAPAPQPQGLLLGEGSGTATCAVTIVSPRPTAGKGSRGVAARAHLALGSARNPIELMDTDSDSDGGRAGMGSGSESESGGDGGRMDVDDDDEVAWGTLDARSSLSVSGSSVAVALAAAASAAAAAAAAAAEGPEAAGTSGSHASSSSGAHPGSGAAAHPTAASAAPAPDASGAAAGCAPGAAAAGGRRREPRVVSGLRRPAAAAGSRA
ncbi:hypothetical protein FOA52_003614 [Chlamydomonas sp. UWO 241]|nr:hypothetical protein FOA52_003614 [Chlamydomonas sp. UWO 241]